MRKLTLAAVFVLAASLAVGAGCTRATGGGEAGYLRLFSSLWQRCHSLPLYEATVENVTKLEDGNKRVIVRYVFDNGEVPDQGRAALLVSPEGQLASDCAIDLETNLCLCGAQKDWQK